MARTPQRADCWSLRQVSLAAGVSLATARAVVRHGHLDAARLSAVDALVLRVATMVSAFQPFDQLRPANAPREVPVRERTAVNLVRAAGLDLPDLATLVLTASSVRLATTLGEVSATTLESTSAGAAYLALPVGHWARELRMSTGTAAA